MIWRHQRKKLRQKEKQALRKQILPQRGNRASLKNSKGVRKSSAFVLVL
jgi:hypothetical protein